MCYYSEAKLHEWCAHADRQMSQFCVTNGTQHETSPPHNNIFFRFQQAAPFVKFFFIDIKGIVKPGKGGDREWYQLIGIAFLHNRPDVFR